MNHTVERLATGKGRNAKTCFFKQIFLNLIKILFHTLSREREALEKTIRKGLAFLFQLGFVEFLSVVNLRSEERRVGKECL